MTEPYTPTTDEVREATLSYTYVIYSEAEFDRWLSQYAREAQRKAWDEGYIAGWRNGNDYLAVLNVNPYEKETS